ncbi:MAG TPA: metallopeptidase TldD-related protein [Gemmatimonadaceae bacterium]|jgi:Predicted Zn-dependent proteases and their inactivated homologs
MSGRGDRLIRLDDSSRFLTRDECARVVKLVKSFAQGGGETRAEISSWWTGELRWARNRVSLASDRRGVVFKVTRIIQGRSGDARTSQLDDVSLESAVRAAERSASLRGPKLEDLELPVPSLEYPEPAIWSDATSELAAEARGQLVRSLVEPSEAQGMLSAGYLEVRAQGVARENKAGQLLYASSTQGQCSITVRDPKGTGSGWAGLSSYDWGRIDAAALSQLALEKCLASRNPVALEPGRYTVILEPQAVGDLVSLIMAQPLQKFPTEGGRGPFVAGRDDALGLYYTKMGLKVVDERITISHDPMDPELGVVPFVGDDPVRAVKWIDRGVLMELAHFRPYAVSTRQDNLGYPSSMSYRMSGGEASVEEMIRTTKRGLLVTRFSNIQTLDPDSLVSTGLTRDGLWLIENGKITKAVKNFRFTESPLFVLNSIEELGRPVPVFSPAAPVIMPPLKTRDFSFTSTIDAI